MAKAAKQVSTKAKRRKPSKRKEASLLASTAAVKRTPASSVLHPEDPEWAPPWPLDKRGKAWLRRHRAFLAAREACKEACDREDRGRSAAELDACEHYSPAARKLGDGWRASMRNLGRDADALGKRWNGRLQFTPAELGTLAIASQHSVSAGSVFARAVVAGGQIPAAEPLAAFKLTPELRALHAELQRLNRAAYYRPSPPEGATRKQWAAYRQAGDEARNALDAFVKERMARHCRGTAFEPKPLTSLSQLIELAIIGAFRLEGDRLAASMIRRAAGV